MSIERQFGKIIFVCDSCEDDIETDKKDFNEALEYTKQEKWRSFRTKTGAWRHYCPECDND